MTEAPAPNHPCVKCGQLDDHPMTHVVGQWGEHVDPSFHFDCLPPVYEAALGDEPQHAVTVAAIAKAREGVHGDDLREFIQAQPSDNEVSA